MEKNREIKKSLLQKSAVFAKLTEDELSTVASSSVLRKYKPMESVFDTDTQAGRLFIVKKGEILISRTTEEGRNTSIASFIEGESFGELDLFAMGDRSTLASAERESELLIYPDGDRPAQSVLSETPILHAKVLHTLLAIVAGRIRSTNRLISERTPWVQELRRQVIVDKLTGLYNSTYLDEDLEGELSKTKGVCWALVIKPDNFKPINDTYGHEAGDETLALLGKTISDAAESDDIAARLHGDVLVLVLRGATLADAQKRAALVLEDIGNVDLAHVTPGADFQLTASIGIAEFTTSADQVLEIANQRMLAARAAGGERTVYE